MPNEKPKPEIKPTAYGFDWGVSKFLRMSEHKGYMFTRLETPKGHLDIEVSPSGLVRINNIPYILRRF